MDSNVKKEEKATEVVATKKAFNLACSWVQKMSGGADFYVEEESKGLREDDGVDVRPMRLGLGAKYLSHSLANRVSSQVDRKLRAKLIPMARSSAGFQGGRRENRGSHRDEEEVVQAEDKDEEEEDDSRASSFKKRSSSFVRPALIVSETTGSKKKKKKKGAIVSSHV